MLSRFPIRRSTNHKLPQLDNGEQRGVIEAELAVSPELSIVLLATHLDHRRGDSERIASAKAINRLRKGRADVAAILAGDLNAVPDSPPMAEFSRLWTRANQRIAPTIPVREPTRQIDYVMFHPANRWRVVATHVLEEATASDHRPFLAVLELDSQ